ncbi:DNA mismatch repair protein MutS [Syncephalastrum racemosum]|uniref:DNA mismatch repair protein MSH3 n=1 Tax=Syncephalastrum racemosum TaxID=13706 RepID=A0A1X2HVU9_SYNRA|nr:DNA mismatch repair protein MutS [Syncephalastrum racemosum]
MLRVCRSPAVNTAVCLVRTHRTRQIARHLHSTSSTGKRVTRGFFDEIFNNEQEKPEPSALNDLVDDLAPVGNTNGTQGAKGKRKALEPRDDTSGSVVLDAVREYTKRHPTCVLLMQVGDFFELYEEHARQYAPLLDLRLTRREMASGSVADFSGFPVRSLDRYLDQLVNRLGCRVALCEQVGTTPTTRGGTLERRITRIITPGTVIEENFLDAQTNNYLLAVLPTSTLDDKAQVGLAWVDISVGELTTQCTDMHALKDDIARIRPRELVLPEYMRPLTDMQDGDAFNPLGDLLASYPDISLTYQAQETFDSHAGQRVILDALQAKKLLDLETLGDLTAPEKAASMALFTYLKNTYMEDDIKIQGFVRLNAEDTLRIDSAAMNSLELFKSLKDGKTADSLLSVLDSTTTSAGSRLLARWLAAPLTSQAAIEKRQDIVEFFASDAYVLHDIRDRIRQSSDAQRAMQRIALQRGRYSDLVEIKTTLSAIQNIKELLDGAFQRMHNALPSAQASLQNFLQDMQPLQDLTTHLTAALNDDYILGTDTKAKSYGNVHPGFDARLSRACKQLDKLQQRRDAFQQQLRALCGNSASLLSTTAYRHVIEVNATRADKLTEAYEAMLINKTKTKHRYQVAEWTELSIKLESTETRIVDIENQVLRETMERVMAESDKIVKSCRALAELDILVGFAWLARERRYVRPKMELSKKIEIKGGRHPVIENKLARKGRDFIQNDCILDKERIWLLTGPNMGGKSTFLRQNAIMVLMAHMGSFIPAQSARIGIADRIFSRVGSADNLAQDQSTFMVEMTETATILRHATERSVVIMDEVGRGTSTKDGISLAYAILEYLHNMVGSRTLFATHYHELADMTSGWEDLQAYKTSLHEDRNGGFSFIHRVQPGVCRQSHGLKVARLSGIPSAVVDKASQVWESLEVVLNSNNSQGQVDDNRNQNR